MDCTPSVEFPRQEYRSRLPFPLPGDLPYPGIESESPLLAGGLFTAGPPRKPIEREKKKKYRSGRNSSMYEVRVIVTVGDRNHGWGICEGLIVFHA